MEDSFSKLFFSAVCFTLLLYGGVKAQENIELAEIRGSNTQIFREFKIEITAIGRLAEYQPVWRESGRPRGRKIVAEPGFEIALVSINARKLGANLGVSVNSLSVCDFGGNEYQAQTRAFYIGANDEAKSGQIEYQYEFPVVIPKGIRFSAVQLQHFQVGEGEPVIQHQKITFDVSRFDW